MSWKTLLIAASVGLALTGCSDDDNDNNVIDPPPPAGISVDETTTMDLTLSGMDKETGVLQFSLVGDEDKAVTGVTEFEVLYYGAPEAGYEGKVFNLPLHQTQQIFCSADGCDGVLVYDAESALYTFTPDNYDWNVDNYDISQYKVGIKVVGAQATTPMDVVDI